MCKFRSVTVFEDEGLCDYYDEVSAGINAVYEISTGKTLESENLTENIDSIRETLCDRFEGCYPAWHYDGDDDVPCYKDECDYHCANCPMLKGNSFPYVELDDSDSPTDAARKLIRCVKCNQDYNPSYEEEEWVVNLITTM